MSDAAGLSPSMVDELDALAPGSVRHRSIDRFALAHDASHYLMVPSGVITVCDADHLARIAKFSSVHRLPICFRSGGTSLSGQASTDALLLDTRREFRAIEVIEGGAAVRAQPGATVRQVNARLARHGRKLGPDPASEAACTIGGVIANNSSGMCCGTEANPYATIRSAQLIFADGTRIDTAGDDADEELRRARPGLWAGLAELRDRIRRDPDSSAEIRRQYAIKNTMGYGLNAFLDHDRPVDILLGLIVGSEGTLAFVAEAVFETVPVKPYAATGLLYFPSLAEATGALPALVASGFAAIELLDTTSLRVAQRDPGADEELLVLDVDRHAALLVEYQEVSEAGLAKRLAGWDALAASLPLAGPATLTRDPGRRAGLWRIRKGLYAAVAGNRPPGTTALLEDIAVPVARLRDTCEGLVDLFERHGYDDAVIFGHAKDGNIHFMLTEHFEHPDAVVRSMAFTEDLVRLVLGHGGTLKAEHGTGRIMAAYVRRQYGDELYGVMLEVKRLLDPLGLLNPGVLLNEDAAAPFQQLKRTPAIEREADRCVECGYCEPVCPSKDLSLTPRQRIVLRRERARAVAEGDSRLAAELDDDYRYDGVDTCAADGMCSIVCPVGIDTGALVKRLRSERPSGLVAAGWNLVAAHWGGSTRAGAVAMRVAAALPSPAVSAVTDVARALLGAETVPRYSADLPSGGERRRPHPADDPVAVYMPSCIGGMFAPAAAGEGVRAAVLELCRRAGVEIRIPDGVDAMCCGTPWSSKGLAAGRTAMADAVVPALLAASDHGRIPVFSDGVSCSEGLLHLATASGIRVIDAVDFAEQFLMPRLRITERLDSIVLHPTCSSTHLGVTEPLLRIAEAISRTAIVPDDWGCCGFAGDRGMLHPELTASATRAEAAEVGRLEADAFASVNRTCELGMSRATGRPYRHILELLEAASR